MINLLGTIPRKISIAFSGGIDSVAALHFLSKNHEIEILYFDHHNFDDQNNFTEGFKEDCAKYNRILKDTVVSTSEYYNTKFKIGECSRPKHKSESIEEYWRNMRYEWFHSLDAEYIVTGHHLNDCVETWIFTSMHGNPHTIPYKNKNVYRPFLLTPKCEFERIVKKNSLAYVDDPSNYDMKRMRNYIRKELVPMVKVVNPGIEKTVKNKILECESDNIRKNDERKLLTF